jgi:hypothetical protein
MAEDQSKPSNDEKPEKKNSFEKMLDELGIKVKKVEPPKDWVRIYIPPNNRLDY